MNVRSEVRAFIDAHPGRAADEMAEMFIRGCSVDDLLPLVVDEFKTAQRAVVRIAEIEALRSSIAFAPRLTDDRLGDLGLLLNEPYRIGDGTLPRRLGEMTIEDHETRLLMLRADIAGLQRSAEVHERAISLIRLHGVMCLDQIAEDAAVAA